MPFKILRGLKRPLFRNFPGALTTELSSRTFYLYSPEPLHPIAGKVPQWMTADEAVERATSDMNIYVQGFSATPNILLKALADHGAHAKLHNVKLIHLIIDGPALHTKPEFQGIFRSNSLFIGSSTRDAVNDGRADYTPIFLGDIPILFRRNIIKLDMALIHVSPPDSHGFCSLGTAVDCTRSAIQNARYIVAQVNPNMPRTFGDGIIHSSHFDAMVHADEPLPEQSRSKANKEEDMIGSYIAENLVHDGATLCTGVGSIPKSIYSKLQNHRDLGIHAEVLGDGMVPLVEQGVITNNRKNILTGKIVGSVAMGTNTLYNFLNNNAFVEMLDVSLVNNTTIIAQNPRVTSINSCIEVDITGQVVSDSIGEKFYSGVGGQLDHIRGAAQGLDGLGMPIMCCQSLTSTGESKIVSQIKKGAGVVTTRAHVHYLVTEYGIAYLFGKTLRQRAHEIIRIAHPQYRETLEKAAFERLKVMPSL